MKTKRLLCLLLAALMLATTLLSGVILPAAEESAPATYVTDGLVSLYKGEGNALDATVWEDSVGDNDLPITKDDKNHFTETGLAAEGAQHYFPQAIVNLVNGKTFSVEIAFGDFTSIGGDYNTFMNSANDNFALFRRNSNDNLEFKWAAKPGTSRPMVGDGLNLIDNGVIAITYEVGGSVCLYVDGTIVSKVSCDTAMGADNLFIGHASAGKKFATTYKSIRFYDRVLTPEEVASNAKVDGATVIAPADKPKSNITVAQPQTNIVGDISLIREVSSKAELEAMVGGKSLPALALYRVNTELKALDAEGNAFATMEEIFSAHDYKIIPAFYLSDKATADALVKYLKAAKFYDVMAVSADPAVIKDFRTTLPQVTAVIDYTETYKDAAALTEEQCLDIRRSIKINNGTVALLPAAVCDTATVQYLYNRQVNVWAKAPDAPSETESYTALLSGAIGVVTDDTDALLEIACNKLPANTVTRATLNIGHRGIPASAPENTVEGSLLAFEQGANVIELDVYLTKDGEVVVMHDGSTGRTCNQDLNVEASTLAQLKELYVNRGYENNSKYKNCRIPTLKEYLEAFKDKDCQLFIEIKSGKTAIVKAVKACVDEYDMYDQCSVITFNEPIMAAMRKDYPEMSVGALCGGYMNGLDPEAEFRSAMTFIGKYNATLNPSSGGFEANDIRAALQRGISIYPWTFRGNLDTYKSHFLWGYSGLTGDNANVFRRVVRNVYHTVDAATPEIGTPIELTVDVTNYGHVTDQEAYSDIVILSGAEHVEVKDGKLTFVSEGTVTYLLTYEAKVSNTAIHFYTQPVTLTVKAPETETSTETPTETPTEPGTHEPATDAPTAEPTPDTDKPAEGDSTTAEPDSQTEAPKGGCKSTLGIATLLLLACAALALGKKKD